MLPFPCPIAPSSLRPRASASVGLAILLSLALIGCGGGSDDSKRMDASIADGNAPQIRKEYNDLVAKSAAIGASSPADASTDAAEAASGVPAAATADGTGATAVAASGTSAGAGSSGAGAAPTASAAATSPHPFALEALAAVNAARAQARRCGDTDHPAVAPLVWNERVAYAALLESEWMLTSNSFGHAWPNGELVWDRLRMAGYDWLVADENIAAGFRNLADAMQAWIDSPPHCVALMRADLREVGIAVVPGAQGNKYLSYWTMALATPRAR